MPSLQSVTQLFTELRCYICFLGDLQTAEQKICQTSKFLKGALHEEWHLLAVFGRLPLRPVGIGVFLHASLASQVQRNQPKRPQDIPEAKWTEAVCCRLLYLIPPVSATPSQGDVVYCWHIPTRCQAGKQV